MNVWFLKDVASEDCFAKDLHDQFSQVWFDMENRGQMMLELERLGGREVAVDFLDRLRLMQKSDAEKHVSLRRMLQLRIVLSVEDKLDYLEQPMPPAPVPAQAGQQVATKALAAHVAWVKGSKEIDGLMLITIELDI
ncbi:hypothetical protein Tco_0914407 [Tanacetum coccineum]